MTDSPQPNPVRAAGQRPGKRERLVTAASLLLGQCVEYDLGNIFDPAYTMVCKLRKALLRLS